MESGLRLRPCTRPACDARRRGQPSKSFCCDEKCLEAIAQASTTELASLSDNARSSHHAEMQHSLARWKAALERAECLCTEMLRLRLPSCCTTQNPERPTPKSQKTASLKPGCSITSLGSAPKFAAKTVTSDPCSSSNLASCSNECCSSSPPAKSCCSSTPGSKVCCNSPPRAVQPQCETSLATSEKNCAFVSSIDSVDVQVAQHSNHSEDIQHTRDRGSLIPTAIDIEKGSVVEHGVIHISGMTCTGCERKVQRVLSNLGGVSNVKTSLVLGRAEFDVNAGLSVSEIGLLVERQTEFKCTIDQEGHHLDVLIPVQSSVLGLRFRAGAAVPRDDFEMSVRVLLSHTYPLGVQDIRILNSMGREWKSKTASTGFPERLGAAIFASKIDTCTARITYNPNIVGARDLLEKGFSTPLSLAPLSKGHASVVDTNRFRQSLYTTSLSALLTIPVLVMAWAPLPSHQIAYGSSSLVLATLVQFIIAGPFYPNALKALLFAGMIEMDLLIVISTTTAYVYSVVAFVYKTRGQPLSTDEFFQTSTLLVTLIMCGRLASAYARRRASQSISIQALQPSTALICENGTERLIDIREFQHDDLFKVLPDSIIPTDGVIASGDTEINESLVTGEAVPVPKSIGSQVLAGSMNGPNPFIARLTKLPHDNTISKIANMVEEARLSKPRVQETADRVASYFVPIILALTIAVFSGWVAVGIAIRKLSTADAIVTALTYALAALIVSCPCAIGLAVPMVIVIASGVGADHGVVFKSPEAIEKARNTSHVVFDKTGTLTQGEFIVVEEVYRGDARNRAASIAQQSTSNSKHPVSQALSTHLESHKNGSEQVANISSIVGKGIQGTLDGQRVQGGNPSFVEAVEDPDVQRILSKGLTVFCLRHGSTLLAIYGLRDALRTDAANVISVLQARNILVSIISGDSVPVVEQVATELGIPLSHAKGACSPEDKARYINSISAGPLRGKTNTTIFCGDGTNDAVALAQADIGIHMAGGTDVAKSAADVVLTRPSLSGILTLIDLSRASMRRVYLNFLWAFVYNLFAILLAAGAFVEARIPPAYAGLGELVSVLPVVGIAMQLRWLKFRR